MSLSGKGFFYLFEWGRGNLFSFDSHFLFSFFIYFILWFLDKHLYYMG